MAYQKAEIIEREGGDVIKIPAGVRTFIDTDEDAFVAVAKELTAYVPSDLMGEAISNGHGSIMVSFAPPEKDLFVPVEVAGRGTGHFYLQPDGEGLPTIATNLYGPNHKPSRGFFDWLLDASPETFNAVKGAAEAIRDVGDEVGNKLKKLQSGALAVIGGLVALGVIVLLVKGKK